MNDHRNSENIHLLSRHGHDLVRRERSWKDHQLTEVALRHHHRRRFHHQGCLPYHLTSSYFRRQLATCFVFDPIRDHPTYQAAAGLRSEQASPSPGIPRRFQQSAVPPVVYFTCGSRVKLPTRITLLKLAICRFPSFDASNYRVSSITSSIGRSPRASRSAFCSGLWIAPSC